MPKKLLITEKPSVAMEFAKALKLNTNRKNGYIEDKEWIITWCVGHLVTMSYPEAYDESLKFWRLDTLPFIPKEWKCEIIPAVENQFNIVLECIIIWNFTIQSFISNKRVLFFTPSKYLMISYKMRKYSFN